jgi:hypothetical protein
LLARAIKNIPVVTFFHNVEASYLKSNLRHFNPLKRCVYSLVKKRPAYICDKYACSYSAKIITLNSCDSVELERHIRQESRFAVPHDF